MIRLIGVILLSFSACALQLDDVSTLDQSVITDCPDDVPFCDPGGGGTSGGGGTGGGGTSGNTCNGATSPCDPTLDSSDFACKNYCGSLSAFCAHTYRCGDDCPEGHIGYCYSP